MSAHPYKAAMLDQLAAQADGIIRMTRERETAIAFWREAEKERAAFRAAYEQAASPSLLARIREWWKRPGFVKSGAEL